MNTKFVLALLTYSFIWMPLFAQIDNSNGTVHFDATETIETASPTGLELPARKLPGLSDNNNDFTPKKTTELGENKPEPIDISKGDGLLDYKTDKAPKYFTKDKEAKAAYGRDQHLGDVKTSALFVHVKYRDHEYVDGDRIRVFVNDDVVQSDISLRGSFHGFKLPLQPGFNRIDFQALNQGASGPNTAELHVYDDQGHLISAHEWNLLTGRKATVIIIKE